MLRLNQLEDSLISEERFVLISEEFSNLEIVKELDVGNSWKKERVNVVKHVLAVP